jgi:hypothetical protein
VTFTALASLPRNGPHQEIDMLTRPSNTRPITVKALKVNVVFKADELPHIDPDNPVFVLQLGSTVIHGRVNTKAARKLAQHQGGVVLQGRLIVEAGNLVLTDAGFSWLEPKPATPDTPGNVSSEP